MVSNRKHKHMNNAIVLGTSIIGDLACPHWSSSIRACLLITDGLFLPIDQYVNTCCLSNYDTSCRHYQLLAGAQNGTRQNPANLLNRRNSIRVPNRHNFRFFEITGPDQYPGSRDNDACTIDLSAQGIRFASRLLLTPDTAIRFSLETDDTAEKVEGTGKVVWCEPLKNTPLYHAGIMFNWPRNTLDKMNYFVQCCCGTLT